ncbi:MAG: hypothetical protein HDR88_10100 [Bacteroides sp.]|nr:hypothetical protein [Bacteroides sp.]
MNELQNMNWACMPKITRDRLISSYFCKTDSSNGIRDYNQGYLDALIHICGKHNLTSHIEPPELIFVERQKSCDFLTEMYEHAKKSESEAELQAFQMAINFIENLLGERCLPETKEQAKSLNIGDKVKIVNVANPMLKDEIGIIKALPTKDESRYEVGIDDGWTLLEAKYLELYVEPTPEFKVGDKAIVIDKKSPHYGEKVTLVKKTDVDWLVINTFSDRFYLTESRLIPYTENKEENSRKQLYDALCQLESASINVRKCLVSL